MQRPYEQSCQADAKPESPCQPPNRWLASVSLIHSGMKAVHPVMRTGTVVQTVIDSRNAFSV